MLRRRLIVLLALPFLASACTDSPSFVPTAPTRASFATSSCELGVSDVAARLLIEGLIDQVNTLETSGALGSGQANALRGHLENVLRQIDEGRYCPALAQLEAFREQVGNFVADGVLTPEQGEALTDNAGQVIVGAPNLVTVDAPSAAAGVYQAGYAEFGPEPTVGGVSGSIVLVNDGTANADLGCNPLVGFPAGAIALVKRGTCPFVVKALNAQAAGAVAVIIHNNVDNSLDIPLSMAGTDPSITIPTVGLTLASGVTIRAGLPATGKVSKKPTT